MTSLERSAAKKDLQSFIPNMIIIARTIQYSVQERSARSLLLCWLRWNSSSNQMRRRQPPTGSTLIPVSKHSIAPHNPAVSRFYLCDHPNKKFISKVLYIVLHGVNTGCSGPHCFHLLQTLSQLGTRQTLGSSKLGTVIEFWTFWTIWRVTVTSFHF